MEKHSEIIERENRLEKRRISQKKMAGCKFLVRSNEELANIDRIIRINARICKNGWSLNAHV